MNANDNGVRIDAATLDRLASEILGDLRAASPDSEWLRDRTAADYRDEAAFAYLKGRRPRAGV